MFIDSHAHLYFERFDNDIEDVVDRAVKAGVGKIVNVACNLKSAKKVLLMAEKFDVLVATVGLHPYDSADCSDECISDLRQLALGSNSVVAIGETGLDYYKCEVPGDVQQNSFRAHLALADELKLPVIVHNRDSEDDCLKIVDEFPDVRCVFHCFASELSYARELWKRGHFTSFTAVITYPNAGDLLEVVREAPIEQIMIETDCPYLSPQSQRGKRNEPAYVIQVAEKIADLRGVDRKVLESQLEQNTKNFFSI